MLVCTWQKRMTLPYTDLNLQYNNQAIPQVIAHKLLGVNIDQNLQWSYHIDMISGKIAQKVYQLNCIKHYLDMQTRKIFYFAYIQPHLDYCSSAWGHCAPSHLKRLHSLQKRALKSILCQNVPDSST